MPQNSPWNVESLEDFLYYCCPECPDRNQSRDDFIQHAIITHPKSNEYLVNFVVKEEVNNARYETDIVDNNLKFDENELADPLKVVTNEFREEQKILITNVKEEENANEENIIEFNDENEDHYKDEDYVPGSEVLVKKYPYKPQKCNQCDKIFDSKQGLANHIRTHKNRNKEISEGDEDDDNFIDTKDGLNSNICGICGKLFSEAGNLKKHINRFHNNDGQQKDYKCNACGKLFTTSSILKNHKIEVHEKLKYKCDFKNCEMSFENVNELYHHKEKDHEGDEKNFSCQHCDKSYNMKRQLKYHIKSVHENQRVTCGTCGKQFVEQRQLTSHFRKVHEGIKNHPCSESGCTKAFNTPNELRTHIQKAHEGIKNEICFECGSPFYDKQALKAHMRVHEKAKNGIKKFRCDFEECDQSFDNIKLLNKHKENDHIGDTPKYQCDQCHKGYNVKHTLLVHIDRIHKGLKEMCTICGKSLSDKTSLKNHIQSHETGRWKVENLPNVIQFHADAEFEDLSNDPKFPSKSWNYFLYNKETKHSKCRFCGSLVNVDKGNC